MDTNDGRKWTVETYAAHNEALRRADERFQAERDRRYSELQELRDLAVRIQADIYAMRLEALNHENERILAASNKSVDVQIFETRMRPVEAFISAQSGRGIGADRQRAMIAWVVALIASLTAIGTLVYRAIPMPQVIYAPASPGAGTPDRK